MVKARVIREYHTPGCSHYIKRAKNAVFISPANSLEHEMKKLEICYNLRKEGKDFITEAVSNKTGLRRDIVILDDRMAVEIETCHSRALRHSERENETDVVVVDLEKNKKWVIPCVSK